MKNWTLNLKIRKMSLKTNWNKTKQVEVEILKLLNMKLKLNKTY